MRCVLSAVVAASTLALPVGVMAQEAIRADCLASVASISKLKFVHEKHKLWYDRFWNGKCTGLSWNPFTDGCTESKPGWNAVVSKVLEPAPAARKTELLAKVCSLGELVGYEWAKDNDKRCVDSTGSRGLTNLEPLMDEKAGGDAFSRVENARQKAMQICPSLKAPQRG